MISLLKFSDFKKEALSLNLKLPKADGKKYIYENLPYKRIGFFFRIIVKSNGLLAHSSQTEFFFQNNNLIMLPPPIYNSLNIPCVVSIKIKMLHASLV